MIRVTPTIRLEEHAVEERFVRSPGPGGQNVNKVATAVQLRLDIDRALALPAEMRARLVRLAGRRLSADGTLVIVARGQRSQERNRAEARQKLVDLLRRAAAPPVPRRATRVPAAEKQGRREDKRRRSKAKRMRRADSED